jgi:putative AdoMet-dependent methyltransferase
MKDANMLGWLFDEAAIAGVDYINESIANDYDAQHESFRNFEEEAEKIAAALGLSVSSVVLDIGCGTGGLSICLAKICRHIYAVDVSKAMIDTLNRKILSNKVANISALQSGFLTYQHKGEQPDAIVANITLHHLPDFWKQIALCNLHDILKDGGKLFLADVVFDFDPRSYVEVINGWLHGMREMVGQKIADETIVHIRDEFSTWRWIIDGMLSRAGFRIDECAEIMPQMNAYICTKI